MMNRPSTSEQDQDPQWDPLYLSSLREAKWIVVAWCVNCAWVVGYCRLYGYDSFDTENIKTILGMPSWAFWGLFVPWVTATVFTIWFALTQMEDHPLEPADVDGEESKRSAAREESE